MPGTIPRKEAVFFGGLELNALLAAGVLAPAVFESGRITGAATTIYDPGGEVLFYRASIVRGRNRVGYADFAAYPGFGAPLLAVGHGPGWDEKALRESATVAARKLKRGFEFDQTRFVAYSYPKIAVQFLTKGKEVLMLELGSWTPVPTQHDRTDKETPSNFERWSVIHQIPADRSGEAEKALRERFRRWEEICPPQKMPQGFDPLRLKPEIFKSIIPWPVPMIDVREVNCFALRGQQTNVWCVAASVEMILDYYRYDYQQTRIAQELGLGTLDHPNGLPYSRDYDVVTALETMTSGALDAEMNTSPTWAEFTAEIKANRPLISFVPGHSRAVAGYLITRMWDWHSFRGLLVYDPWPPTVGVVTRWENFDATTYRRTFTAKVKLV